MIIPIEPKIPDEPQGRTPRSGLFYVDDLTVEDFLAAGIPVIIERDGKAVTLTPPAHNKPQSERGE